jgi:hypothetical protein
MADRKRKDKAAEKSRLGRRKKRGQQEAKPRRRANGPRHCRKMECKPEVPELPGKNEKKPTRGC